MKYVLDASVAARWVLRNPLQGKALKLRAEYQQNIHELIAHPMLRFHYGNRSAKVMRACGAASGG